MAKGKVTRPTGNKKVPPPKPVDRFPYMAVKPNDDPTKRPMYRDHKEAVKKLREEVFATFEQFRNLNAPEIRQDCSNIIEALGRLPRDGGVIDLPLGPVRYRVELVLRKAV